MSLKIIQKKKWFSKKTLKTSINKNYQFIAIKIPFGKLNVFIKPHIYKFRTILIKININAYKILVAHFKYN